MYIRDVKTAGELAEFLRGIPQHTPLRIVRGQAEQASLGAGYGTDPRDHRATVVVLDLNPTKMLNGASA